MKRFIVLLTVTAMLLSSLAGFGTAEDYKAYVYGDCNMDGKVTLSDVTLTLQHIAKWDVTVHPLAADVNVDGDVTLRDVTLLLRFIAGWDVNLGVADEYISTGEYTFTRLDFNREELRILYYGKTATDYYDEYIYADDMSIGIISEAVAERNKIVSDEYNVKIKAEECGPAGEAVKRQMAGQCDFDLIYEWGTRMQTMALDGWLYDVRDIDYYYTVNTLDRDYWLPQANEGLTVDESLYVFVNMISMNPMAYAETIFFNKNILDELDLTWPYELVEDGTWTYDVLIDMALAAEDDVNRDGIYDNRDRYGGIVGEDILLSICDESYVGDDVSFVPYTESMVGLYNKFAEKARSLRSLTDKQILSGTDTSGFPSVDVAVRYLTFGNGNTLFMKGVLDNTKEFVDMHDDYGIVPMPATEEGGDYTSRGDVMAPMFAIPTQIANPEMAIVIDFMAYKSSKLLYPTYIESTIKTKRMEDVRDYDMLDYITSGVEYRWTDIYMQGTIANTLHRDMIKTGNFASLAKQYGAKCAGELQGIVDKITLLG